MCESIISRSNAVRRWQANALLLGSEATSNGYHPATSFVHRASHSDCGSTLISQHGEVPARRVPPKGVRPNGVLLVEDHSLLRKSLGKGLEDRGFELWSAANGAEAIEIYENSWPLIDVVLSDVRMPVLDGPGTLAALLRINPSVRLCFMTCDHRPTTRTRLLELGALLVFKKPLDSVADIAQQLWELADSHYQGIDGSTDAAADLREPEE